MKKILIIMFLTLLSFGVNAFAAGDLTVNGTLNVGAGGVKFPDGSTQTTAISPTTQNNVTASRALGIVYQNTTGKPMWVRMIGNSTAIFNLMIAYSDSSNPPTTIKDEDQAQNVSSTQSVGFWVLPGNYYKIIAGAGTPKIVYWIEDY